MKAQELYDSIQVQGTKRIDEKARQILSRIEKLHGHFPYPHNIDNMNKLYMLLGRYWNHSICQLLESYNYSYETELQYLLANIGHASTQQKERQIFPLICQYPSLSGLDVYDREIVLHTKIGEITVEPLCMYPNEKVKKFILQDNWYGYCHEASLNFIKENRDYEAVTSLIVNQFGEKQYHSYIQDKEGIMDLSHQLYIPQEDFIRVMKPEELNRVSGTDLETQEKNLTKTDLGEEKTLLLRLAVSKQK